LYEASTMCRTIASLLRIESNLSMSGWEGLTHCPGTRRLEAGAGHQGG
jgi:hypothetical protein